MVSKIWDCWKGLFFFISLLLQLKISCVCVGDVVWNWKMDDFDDEGNAADLQFGKEFAQDVQFLMNDEVYVLLRILPKGRGGAASELVFIFCYFSSVFLLSLILIFWLLDCLNCVFVRTFNKTYQYTSKVAASSDPEILKGVATELRRFVLFPLCFLTSSHLITSHYTLLMIET